jgi:hypothetical protein
MLNLNEFLFNLCFTSKRRRAALHGGTIHAENRAEAAGFSLIVNLPAV